MCSYQTAKSLIRQEFCIIWGPNQVKWLVRVIYYLNITFEVRQEVEVDTAIEGVESELLAN